MKLIDEQKRRFVCLLVVIDVSDRFHLPIGAIERYFGKQGTSLAKVVNAQIWGFLGRVGLFARFVLFCPFPCFLTLFRH